MDAVTLVLQQAFLSALDSETIRKNLIRKIQSGESLSEEEMMQFIILPLTYKGKERKNESIKELFELSKNMEEESVQLFLLSGILVFTDKVIDEETAKRIKEWISMTKVARLFEEEKLAAVAEAVEKEREQAKQAVEKEREKAERERANDIIDMALDFGYSNEEILSTLQKKLRIKEKQADEYLRKFYDKTL